jgi:hypothetical protein
MFRNRQNAQPLQDLPVPLEEREIVLLAQGMNRFGHLWMLISLPGWVCIFCYMPFGLIGTFLNPPRGEPLWRTSLSVIVIMLLYLLFLLWPWLLSGRYWLTTRRLIWRRHLGRPVHLRLDEIQADRIRAFAWTQGLHVPGERAVVLRFVKGLPQLWGGILLLQTPRLSHTLEEAPSAAPARPQIALIPHATCSNTPGRTGLMVLSSDFVAFIPAELQDHAVETTVEALFSIFPYSPPRSIYPELPLTLVVERLAQLPAERFAMQLRYLTGQHEGVYWRNWNATTVACQSVGPKRALGLRFAAEHAVLNVTVPPLQKARVQHILADWYPC